MAYDFTKVNQVWRKMDNSVLRTGWIKASKDVMKEGIMVAELPAGAIVTSFGIMKKDATKTIHKVDTNLNNLVLGNGVALVNAQRYDEPLKIEIKGEALGSTDTAPIEFELYVDYLENRSSGDVTNTDRPMTGSDGQLLKQTN